MMDTLLDDPKLVLAVANDLAQSAPQSLWNGRPATPVVVTLRLAVLRRLMNWSYRTAEQEVRGSLRWRWFCHIDAHPVPDHSTLQARERLIQPATLHRLHDRVVALARQHQVTQGKKMRADSAVIATHIQNPTDSRLLSDSVRVLGRTLKAARRLLTPPPSQTALFRNHARQAKRLARRLAAQNRPKKGQKPSESAAEAGYRRLLKVTQTTRRVLEHQEVPASEKLVSLFEPHTAIIRRGKAAPHDTEFGRKLWFSEVEGGIVSEYRVKGASVGCGALAGWNDGWGGV